MYSVYVLKSQTTESNYVGSTHDMVNRLAEHNRGESKSTKRGIPWRVIHTVEFATRSEAMRLERRIKSRGIGRWLRENSQQQPG